METVLSIVFLILVFWVLIKIRDLVFWIIYKIHSIKVKIKGYIGELKTNLLLLLLSKKKYKVIHNVMVKDRYGTSQIDYIVISSFGVFVIETKNYKGIILGSERSTYWTQVLGKKRYKLYNPVLQNDRHAEALFHNLREFDDIILMPIVVFSLRARLRVDVEAHVVHPFGLLRILIRHKEDFLNERTREEIYKKILSVNITDRRIRRKHVVSIKSRYY